MTYNSRNEVPEKYRWDLTKWFKTDDDWYLEYEDVKKHVNDLVIYKGKIFESDNLYTLLDQYYKYNNRIETLYVYTLLKQDEDLSVSKYNKMYQEIAELDSKFVENMSFMMPEILHSELFDVDKLIEKTPKLERFRHLLEEFNLNREYIKDEKTEELIATLTKDFNHYGNMANTILNSDIDYGEIEDEKGNKVRLNTGNISFFTTSFNRDIRKKAYLKFHKKRNEFTNSLGKNLIAFMKRHASITKIRGYKSTKEMDFKNDYVPIEVHNALKENAKRGIPLFRSFYELLKDMLHLEQLESYDLHAPVLENNKEYTVEEAQKYFYDASKIIGNDYALNVKKGFDERWIDYMPYKGKQSGGYCFSIYGNTSNILMNFNGRYDDISTIAHEMGHAIQADLSFEKHGVEYAYHTLYTAEIPSLFNEIILANYILENDFTKEEKISVIIEMLRIINSNFFSAIMENELEDIVYEKLDHGDSVSSEDLNIIMRQLLEKYYGNTFNIDECKESMWSIITHYFNPWYLYKYSTCICGAVYFASKIIKGDKEVLNSYNEFLKSGNDEFPNDLLLRYGIDLTDNKIYDELFEYYELLLNKLKELMN